MAKYIERAYGKQGLHSLAVHPGSIWTPLQQHLPQEQIDVWKTPEVDKGMKSPEQGAATTVLAAVGKEFEGRGGVYLEDCGEWGLSAATGLVVLEPGHSAPCIRSSQ